MMIRFTGFEGGDGLRWPSSVTLLQESCDPPPNGVAGRRQGNVGPCVPAGPLPDELIAPSSCLDSLPLELTIRIASFLGPPELWFASRTGVGLQRILASSEVFRAADENYSMGGRAAAIDAGLVWDGGGNWIDQWCRVETSYTMM